MGNRGSWASKSLVSYGTLHWKPDFGHYGEVRAGAPGAVGNATGGFGDGGASVGLPLPLAALMIPDTFHPYRLTGPERARGGWTCTHFHGNFFCGHVVCSRTKAPHVIGVPAMGVHSGNESREVMMSKGLALRSADG